MSNPYTSGEDINPFAEDLKQPQGGSPPPQAAPAAAAPAATSPGARAATPPQFYNPTSSAEAQGPQYNPSSGGATFVQPQTPPPQQQGYGGQPGQYGQQPPGQPQDQGPSHQAQPARELQTAKFWRLEFYQQFFDVNTVDVMRRISNVLVPFSPPDFLQNREWHSAPGGPVGQWLSSVSERASRNEEGEKNADLYGPFWLCTTLWITIGVVGNFVSKLHHIRSASKESWQYDFKEASIACIVVYSYVALMSLVIWAMMKWKAVPAAFQDVLCVYGYSMFVPFLGAILCGVPNAIFQWAVCLLCGFWSCFYLLANFWRLWRNTLEKGWFTFIVAFVIVFQAGFTMSLKFYFFNY